jgi:hypothetical protein
VSPLGCTAMPVIRAASACVNSAHAEVAVVPTGAVAVVVGVPPVLCAAVVGLLDVAWEPELQAPSRAAAESAITATRP